MIEQNHMLYHLSVLEGSLNGIDNKKISNDVLSNKDKRLGTFVEDSKYEDTNCPSSTELDSVVNLISKDFEKVTGTHTLSLKNFWGHIQEKNMSTNYHNHPDCDVSCVYYCQIPKNSARIVFMWKEDQDANPHEYSITPQEGRYILFPSYLYHYVPRNESEIPRVSISFNFNTHKIDKIMFQDDE